MTRLFVALAIVLCALSHGATYYVASDGSDTTGDGSVGSPYATLDKALSKVSLAAGDIISIGAGTFTDTANTDVSGSAGNPITIVGNGVGSTVMSGKLTIDTSYYVVSNLTYHGGGILIDAPATGVIIDTIDSHRSLRPLDIDNGTTNCIVRNSWIHHGAANGFFDVAGYGHVISSNVFSHNNGYDVHRVNGAISCLWSNNVYNQISTAVNLATTSATSTAIATGEKTFTVADERAYPEDTYIEIYSQATPANYMRGWCVSVSGTTLVVDVTTVGGSGTYSDWIIRDEAYGNHADCFQAFGSAGSQSYDCVVEKCLFFETTSQLGNFEGDGVSPVPIHDWVFRNNVFDSSRIQINIFELVYGFLFHNNTVYNTGGTSGFHSLVYVYNNIFCRVGDIESAGPYAGEVDADFNLITDYPDDSEKTGYSEPNGINGGYTPAQIFVDAPNGDFRLAIGSPAIGAGTNLSAHFTWDITGTTRTGTWDIGAYEYPDTTAPTLSSASINSGGTNLTLVFDEDIAVTAGTGVTVSIGGGAQACTYFSGTGTTAIVFTCPQIYYGQTVTVTYTQPGDGLEDLVGNDVATFTDEAVNNGSTAVTSQGGSSISGGTFTGGTIR